MHLRMPRHCENALQLAHWLEQNPSVQWVNFPGLESHADHGLAQKYLPDGQGAIVGFGIKGGMEAGKIGGRRASGGNGTTGPRPGDG